jgi:hypothetical protein
LPLDDTPRAPNADTADSLREQAAACRRLANSSRTRAGRTSLDQLADHFDDQARKLDPFSERR